MIKLEIAKYGHKWEKKNLVTISAAKSMYDIYQCSKCELKGRSYQIGIIVVKSSYSKSKIYGCNNVPQEIRKVRINRCGAFGPAFANLTPGSEHNVIDPPAGYKNDGSGLWVMGVGEPVCVLANEFTILE